MTYQSQVFGEFIERHIEPKREVKHGSFNVCWTRWQEQYQSSIKKCWSIDPIELLQIDLLEEGPFKMVYLTYLLSGLSERANVLVEHLTDVQIENAIEECRIQLPVAKFPDYRVGINTRLGNNWIMVEDPKGERKNVAGSIKDTVEMLAFLKYIDMNSDKEILELDHHYRSLEPSSVFWSGWNKRHSPSITLKAYNGTVVVGEAHYSETREFNLIEGGGQYGLIIGREKRTAYVPEGYENRGRRHLDFFDSTSSPIYGRLAEVSRITAIARDWDGKILGTQTWVKG